MWNNRDKIWGEKGEEKGKDEESRQREREKGKMEERVGGGGGEREGRETRLREKG